MCEDVVTAPALVPSPPRSCPSPIEPTEQLEPSESRENERRLSVRARGWYPPPPASPLPRRESPPTLPPGDVAVEGSLPAESREKERCKRRWAEDAVPAELVRPSAPVEGERGSEPAEEIDLVLSMLSKC